MSKARDMRTTLSIDDDVLAAAKELAERENKSVGDVITSLARQALRPKNRTKSRRNGVPLLPVRSGATRVTPALVNQLRDELN
jgi:hypothetical protein